MKTQFARPLLGSLLGWLMFAAVAPPLRGQSLPQPSRSMYKCVVGKQVTYTDEPCLGAERIEVEPTRGVNSLSGKARTGPDVANEQRREMWAEALRPLTGLDAKGYAAEARRSRLSSAAHAECARLDVANAQMEAAERAADASAKPAVQRDLLTLRKRFKDLRC
jgi:hypothetical protein